MAKQRNKRTYPYRPNYAVPPGWLLNDYPGAWELTPAELAGRHSLPTELIESIAAGAAPIGAGLAGILEQEFGLAASVLLSMEATYRRSPSLASNERNPAARLRLG